MAWLIQLIATPLGALMRILYRLIGSYGVTILAFTLCTKLILFPVNLIVQKNAVKMVRMRPRLDALKFKYVDDKDRLLDEQVLLYKQEKYRPFAGLIPLCIQIPLILGLINVIYQPMTHVLHIDGALIEAIVGRASELLGGPITQSPQLKAVQMVQSAQYASGFDAMKSLYPQLDAAGALEAIRSMNLRFLGFDLAITPSIGQLSAAWIIPALAALSAWLLSFFQNRVNVLSSQQGKLSQWGMTAFLTAFSGVFAFIVPIGVGLYWIAGNLMAIPFLYLVNWAYDPRKHIDYQYLDAMKRITAQKDALVKKHKKRSRADYKRFCAVQDMRLMFYSEQSGFYKYFQNIIQSVLKNSDLTIHYVTSDPNDGVFSMDQPRIQPYYVNETDLIPLMMKVESDVVVMTVPDLEKYHVKRSRVRKDVEYIFVDHGGTSLNLTYRTGAFDYFDTIFAVNQRQVDEVRAMEKLRGTKKKTVVNCGYGLLDNMIAAYESQPHAANSVKTVLIAPSWQDGNILDSCLDPLLNSLLDRGWRVILRPHPQYIRRFPINMDAISRRWGDRTGESFQIQTDFSSSQTVYESDLVITDWSAIGVEFSLTTCKPTLFINTPMKVVNPDWEKISVVPFIIEVRGRIGASIDPDRIETAGDAAAELMERGQQYRERILQVRREFLFNPGFSGDVGAAYIIERIRRRHG